MGVDSKAAAGQPGRPLPQLSGLVPDPGPNKWKQCEKNIDNMEIM